MTNEEAINALKMMNLRGAHPFLHWEEMMEVRDMAISALRQQEHFREATKKVEPLTLDDLRQMQIGDWVWIDVLHSKETVSSYYRKYDGYKKDEIFWCGYPGLGFRFFYEDYGKTWLAYRQKPEDDDHDA